METPFQLKTDDGHILYGTEQYPQSRPPRVVIFIHGLTGHSNELIHWLGAKYFNERGYGAVRFDLYSGREGARRLDNATVAHHAKDTNKVIEYCREQGYEHLFIVAHSLGGPVVLLCDTSEVAAITLWDPTYNTRLLVEQCSTYDSSSKGRFIDWGIKQFWGTQMAEELLAFPDCGELIARVAAPIKIITPENKDAESDPERYYACANEPKAHAIIPRASHCFVEEHAPELLFRETLEWFDG